MNQEKLDCRPAQVPCPFPSLTAAILSDGDLTLLAGSSTPFSTDLDPQSVSKTCMLPTTVLLSGKHNTVHFILTNMI